MVGERVEFEGIFSHWLVFLIETVGSVVAQSFEDKFSLLFGSFLE